MKHETKFNVGMILITIALIAVILVLILYFNQDNQEPVTSKPVSNITKEELNKLYNDYIVTSVAYQIIDLNQDGIDELLIKTGVSEKNYELHIYTYDEKINTKNHIVNIGNFFYGNTSLYVVKSDIILVSKDNQYEISYLKMQNNWLIRNKIEISDNLPTEINRNNLITLNERTL